MKKIFTLTMGVLFAIALMAADRRPVVTISSGKNFKIVIDGRSYFGSDMTISLNHLYYGRHSISVYEMRRGYFHNRERLISSSTFFLTGNDMHIRIDWFGNISIKERKYYRRFGNNDNRGWDNDDRNYDRRNDDRDYDRRNDNRDFDRRNDDRDFDRRNDN